MHAVHGSGDKDFKCESCGKSFCSAGTLRNHIHTVHEGHKDFKCESCGKSMASLQILKNHIHTVHEGCKDYKCDYCGKLFTTARSLKRHIQMHTVHKDSEENSRIYQKAWDE